MVNPKKRIAVVEYSESETESSDSENDENHGGWKQWIIIIVIIDVFYFNNNLVLECKKLYSGYLMYICTQTWHVRFWILFCKLGQ